MIRSAGESPAFCWPTLTGVTDPGDRRNPLTNRQSDAEHARPRRSRLKFAPGSARGDKEKFAGRDLEPIHFHRTVRQTKSAKAGRSEAWRPFPQLHFSTTKWEHRTRFSPSGRITSGLEIIEVDRLQRRLDLQLARRPVAHAAFPVEETKSRVAILLDLDEQIPRRRWRGAVRSGRKRRPRFSPRSGARDRRLCPGEPPAQVAPGSTPRRRPA